MNLFSCNNCQTMGMRFERRYRPADFIEGEKNSLIWIVGLNPAAAPDWKDEPRGAEELEKCFSDKNSIHTYFKNFEKVSPCLFESLGEDHGTAHTDIVKCSSRAWPPEGVKGKAAGTIISNCKPYLECQIREHKPKIIVCNGAPVSEFMLTFLPPQASWSKAETSYWSKHDDNEEVCVVLSGFIGRLDDYAKRRLGVEIERRLGEISKQDIKNPRLNSYGAQQSNETTL